MHSGELSGLIEHCFAFIIQQKTISALGPAIFFPLLFKARFCAFCPKRELSSGLGIIDFSGDSDIFEL
jgi:hypothetical protein